MTLFNFKESDRQYSGYTRERGLLVPVRSTEPEAAALKNKFKVAGARAQVETKKRATNLSPRLIPVFDMGSLETAYKKVKRADSDHRNRLLPEIELAFRNDGKRQVPKLGNLLSVMKKLESHFPNFTQAISGIGEELALAAASRPSDFRFSPLLLNGVPGIGKTAFAQELAARFGLPFLNINAGNLQHAATLVGTSSHWTNAAPGDIFNLFANGDSAVAILLLDEVDKVNPDPEYSILPVLLDLLEPETSRHFKDISMGVNLDASHLIVLMTSNQSGFIDKALLSRSRIYEVQKPDWAQRMAIMNRWVEALEKQTRTKLEVEPAVIQRLAGLPMDLRALQRALRSAYGRSLLEKSDVLQPPWNRIEQQRRSVGFM
ncbi:ATP-binding protein [Ferrovum myxofaciens]|uniref:AAA family ATPase n=3 Tax=Ferrovum myxofaciens TaxID=416213 RepID=A0A859AB54_9PROT|nr:ATP-binding protein [Ferrovum myxofaciens]KXW57250.1 Lon protease [Ferrovum myxofaciens]QKE39126.1 MAG: AAA family ATPase [Ferrovum myxofaciens]QWY74367.1 MAG: AAA family ATPase [Ferrovum myxofaciens]QWY77118.1 MAG: AAA family ATPase [Ferrovum myxofaciens]